MYQVTQLRESAEIRVHVGSVRVANPGQQLCWLIPTPPSSMKVHKKRTNKATPPAGAGAFDGAASKEAAKSALTLISFNVEGLSDAKSQILSKICTDNNCDVLCLQETHRGSKHRQPQILNYGI